MIITLKDGSKKEYFRSKVRDRRCIMTSAKDLHAQPVPREVRRRGCRPPYST